MKPIKKLCLILLILAANSCIAGNIFGSDIFWKRLTNDTFQVTFEIYNDCAEPLDNINPEVTPFQCSGTIPVKFGKCISHTTLNVTPRCKMEVSKCEANPTLPYGIDKNVFIYNVYLGANVNCCWYKIILKGLSRDDEISNGNALTGFETSASLDKCVSSNMESIMFRNRPFAIKYRGYDNGFNQGTYQSSFDSVSFSLQPPINSTFSPPYSAKYPFACYGGNIKPTFTTPYYGFGLDSITGDITSRPTLNGFYIFSVEARQWKKINNVYTLVGVQNRELMYIVVTLPPSNPPMLSGPFSYESMPGQQVCFYVNTNDADVEDTTRLFWDGKLPATFSTNNGMVKHASGQFCWTPSDDDASCLPYYVGIIAFDDHCPLSESTTRQYSILIKPLMKSKQKFTRINCHTYQFKNTPTNRSGCLANQIYSTKWGVSLVPVTPLTTYSGDSIRYDFKEGGIHIVKCVVSAPPDAEVYFDTLNIDTFAAVNIINTDSIINPNDTVILYAKTTFSSKPNQYQWWANGKLIDTTSSILVHPNVSTTYTLLNKALSPPCDITDDNVMLIVPGTIGVNQTVFRQSFRILTNPFNTFLTINNEDGEFHEMTLISMDGRLVLQTRLSDITTQINTVDLAKGIYLLKLGNGEHAEKYKVIKN